MNATPRVRVSHPRTESALHGRNPVAARGFQDDTALGSASVTTLIEIQRRLVILIVALVAAGLAGTAVLGFLAPDLDRIRLLGVPLPWVILGVLVYPALILAGVAAVRRFERNETAFTRLLGRR
ncbi:hypothetical protein [Nocardia nova]|uniref:hypothetical protein n=1 Tax=Nocardia nova TaxID=37330 RepID=UPI0033DA023D